jgi:hypothetical protein
MYVCMYIYLYVCMYIYKRASNPPERELEQQRSREKREGAAMQKK